MRHTLKTLSAATFALLLLAACGSSGIGDVLGGSSGNQTARISGTVDSVDLNSSSIYLTNVSGYTSMLSSGNSVRVFFDNRTTVSYQGQTYRPQDLERGDQVSMVVDQSNNNQLIAQSVDVTYDARGGNGGAYPAGGTYGSTVRGTVRSFDASRGLITLNTSTYGTSVVEVSSNTPVYFNGQTYRPSDLENGDVVDVRTQDLGGGRLVAQDITVVQNVRGTNNGSYPSGTYPGNTYPGSTYPSQTSQGTLRGTVQYVDTTNHTIQLTSTSWTAGFNRNTTTGSTITVQYDPSASINVQGQLYPISGLERGDVVDVQVQGGGNAGYFAQSITLVRDVRY